MATNLDIHEGLLDAQTLFEVLWLDAYENPSAAGAYQMYTMISRSNAKRKTLNTFGAGPVMSEWTGEKKFQQFRHYDLDVDVKNYEKSLALDANDVNYDPVGAVRDKLTAWFGTGGDRDLDKIIFDSLVSASGLGPTGYDGVSLLNTAHPHVNSGSNESNTGTSALSFSTFDTAFQTMTEFKNEAGELFGITPTHLMVGPKNRKMALQIADANLRSLAVDNAGDETGTRVAASAVTNVYQGWVTVIINPRLEGTQDDYWYLLDLSNPSRLPFGFMLNRGPLLVSKDRDEDDNRFYNNEVHHSIELDGAPHAAFWPAIYGGIL